MGIIVVSYTAYISVNKYVCLIIAIMMMKTGLKRTISQRLTNPVTAYNFPHTLPSQYNGQWIFFNQFINLLIWHLSKCYIIIKVILQSSCRKREVKYFCVCGGKHKTNVVIATNILTADFFLKTDDGRYVTMIFVVKKNKIIR